jgi:hypothetical protein
VAIVPVSSKFGGSRELISRGAMVVFFFLMLVLVRACVLYFENFISLNA